MGTALEFHPPGSFKPIDDMVGGGPANPEPGQWTDDTAMALCLAESLIERNGFDPVDQLERYVRWLRQGHLSSTGQCIDVGNIVASALLRFERTREPLLWANRTGHSGEWFYHAPGSCSTVLCKESFGGHREICREFTNDSRSFDCCGCMPLPGCFNFGCC